MGDDDSDFVKDDESACVKDDDSAFVRDDSKSPKLSLSWSLVSSSKNNETGRKKYR